jgi:hypothetical protein
MLSDGSGGRRWRTITCFRAVVPRVGWAMATALRRTAVAAVLLPVGTLAGCGRAAMTTDEFLAQQTGSGGTNRPALRDVAATFRDRKTAGIQDVQTSINGPANRRLITRWLYHETLDATDKKVELIVQVTPPAAVQMYEQTEHGIYALIARAVPIDGRRSRLTRDHGDRRG